jgi:hypothetical protein
MSDANSNVQSAPAPATPPNRTKALAIPPDECARQIRQAFGWQEGEHREVRVLGPGGISKAIVDSPEAAVRAVQALQYGAGIYITMNAIAADAAILKTGSSMLRRAGRGECTTDADIGHRANFAIDVDPVRGTNTGASDEQLDAARELADKIEQELVAEGWPMPTRVDSGNGVHLYFRIDLDAQSDLPKRALEGLAARFSTPSVKVDTSVHNQARIMRMPGTWNVKGSDLALHRVAQLVRVGDDRLLTPEQLEAVATKSAVEMPMKSDALAEASLADTSLPFDVAAWLVRYGVKHGAREDWPGGGVGAHRWVLPICPFNPAHDQGEAVVTRSPSGPVGFRCLHDSCSQFGWQEFRAAIERAAAAERRVGTLLREPYPVDALPTVIRSAVSVQASLVDADPASVAIPLLAAFMGAVGNAVLAQPWAGWTEAMACWAVLVAPSGSMKSATIGFSEGLIQELERGFPPASEESPRERLQVGDITTEALAQLAEANPRGLLCIRDELAAVLGGFNQYKKSGGSDEQFWLSAIDGKSHFVDRKSSQSASIPRLTISMLGGIQPQIYASAVAVDNRIQSGLAARFWTIWPPRRLIQFRIPDPADEVAYKTTRFQLKLALKAMREIPMPGGEPTVVDFSKAARERMFELMNDLERRKFQEHESSPMLPCIAKARGWTARLATLLRLIKAYEERGVFPDGMEPPRIDFSHLVVGIDEVADAIRLVEWQLTENRRGFGAVRLDAEDLQHERDHELAMEALDRRAGSLTSRELQRSARLNGEQANDLLQRLVKSGRWREEHPKPGVSGGRPTVRYFPIGLSSLS